MQILSAVALSTLALLVAPTSTDATAACSVSQFVSNDNIAAVDTKTANSQIKVGYQLYLQNGGSATCTVSPASFYIPGHCEGDSRQVNVTVQVPSTQYSLSGNTIAAAGQYQSTYTLDGSMCGDESSTQNVQLDSASLAIGSITCDQPNQVVCLQEHYYVTPTANNPALTQNATNGQYANATCVQACYTAPTSAPTSCVSSADAYVTNDNIAVLDQTNANSYINAGYEIYLQDAAASATCAVSGVSYTLPGHCEGDSSQLSIEFAGASGSYQLSNGASYPVTAGQYQSTYNFNGQYCGSVTENNNNHNAQIDASYLHVGSVSCDQPNQVVCIAERYYVTPTAGQQDFSGTNQGHYGNATCFTACYTAPTATAAPTPCNSSLTQFVTNDNIAVVDQSSANSYIQLGYNVHLQDSTSHATCSVQSVQYEIPGHCEGDSSQVSLLVSGADASYTLANGRSYPATLNQYQIKQSFNGSLCGSAIDSHTHQPNPNVQLDHSTLTIGKVTCNQPNQVVCFAEHYYITPTANNPDFSGVNQGHYSNTTCVQACYVPSATQPATTTPAGTTTPTTTPTSTGTGAPTTAGTGTPAPTGTNNPTGTTTPTPTSTTTGTPVATTHAPTSTPTLRPPCNCPDDDNYPVTCSGIPTIYDMTPTTGSITQVNTTNPDCPTNVLLQINGYNFGVNAIATVGGIVCQNVDYGNNALPNNPNLQVISCDPTILLGSLCNGKHAVHVYNQCGQQDHNNPMFYYTVTGNTNSTCSAGNDGILYTPTSAPTATQSGSSSSSTSSPLSTTPLTTSKTQTSSASYTTISMVGVMLSFATLLM